MRPVFGANWRTAADVKSVHDHLSRHHAGPKFERAHFDIGSASASARAHTCPDMPAVKTGNRRREPGVCRLPPRTAAGLAVRIISMAVRDHASLVTHHNRNLASTTVINSSQRRTCATMLALTSHYMATNAKHPRYAPGLFAWLATHCNRRGRYRLREKVCREFWGLRSVALGLRSGYARVHTRCRNRHGARDWVSRRPAPGPAGGSPGPGRCDIDPVLTGTMWHCPGCSAVAGAGAVRREGGRRGRRGGGRDGGVGAYGMMWEKGGVWGLGVI